MGTNRAELEQRILGLQNQLLEQGAALEESESLVQHLRQRSQALNALLRRTNATNESLEAKVNSLEKSLEKLTEEA